MVAEFLAALRALPALAKAAESIAEGVRELNHKKAEQIAKERLDEKNRTVTDFISAIRVKRELRDNPQVQRGSGDSGETSTGVD